MNILYLKVGMEELTNGQRGLTCRCGLDNETADEIGCGIDWPENISKTPSQVSVLLRAFADAVDEWAETQ